MKGSVFKRCKCQAPKDCKKKGCGSWYYAVDLGFDANGKRRLERRGGFRTKTEAQDACDRVASKVRDRTYADDEGLTVSEWLEEWLTERIKNKKIRPGTYTLYEGHIRSYLKPRLGRIRLRDLRVSQVQRAFAEIAGLKDGPQAGTIHRIRTTLRSALNAAKRRQLIGTNPAVDIELPAEKRPEVKPWSAKELGRFLDDVAAHRLAPLFEVAAATGMRRGEICGLRWEDIDLVDGVITVRQQITQNNVKNRPTPLCPHCSAVHKGLEFGPPKTKGGENRKVELDSGTIGVLLAHRFRQDEERNQWGTAYIEHGLVFAKEDGNPLVPGRVYEIFQEVGAQVRFDEDCDKPDEQRRKLPPTRLHDLRHAAASLRLAAGVDIAIVSKTLGHSTTKLTQDTYSHLLPGVARGAAEKANALIPRTRRTHSVPNTPETEKLHYDPDSISAGQSGAGEENRTPTISLGKSEESFRAVTPDD